MTMRLVLTSLIVFLLILLLFLFPLGQWHVAAVGPTIVQNALQNADDVNGCSNSCSPASFSNPVSAGDTIVVLISYSTLALYYQPTYPPSIKDSLNTHFQEVGSTANCQNLTNSLIGLTILAFVGIAPSTGPDTVTWVFNQVTTPDVAIYEISGLASNDYPEFSASNQASFNCMASTSISVTPSLAVGDSGIVLAMVGQVTTNQTSWTAGTGYTLVTGDCSQGSPHFGCSEYEQSASGTTTAPMTYGTSGEAVELAMTWNIKCGGACIVQMASTSANVLPLGFLNLTVNSFASTTDYLVVVGTAYGIDINLQPNNLTDSMGNAWTPQVNTGTGGAVNHQLAVIIWTSPVTATGPDVLSLAGDKTQSNSMTLTLYEVSGITLSGVSTTEVTGAGVSGTSMSMPALTIGSSGLVIGGWTYYSNDVPIEEAASSYSMSVGTVQESCAFVNGCSEFVMGASGSTTVQMISSQSSTHALGAAITFNAGSTCSPVNTSTDGTSINTGTTTTTVYVIFTCSTTTNTTVTTTITVTTGVTGVINGFPDYTPIFIFMILVTIMLAILYKWFKRYGPDEYGKGIEV